MKQLDWILYHFRLYFTMLLEKVVIIFIEINRPFVHLKNACFVFTGFRLLLVRIKATVEPLI